MEKTISATEANRTFSSLLREVADGHAFTITNHGQPVARLAPTAEDVNRAARAEMNRILMERLRSQEAIDIGPWTRSDLYEDE